MSHHQESWNQTLNFWLVGWLLTFQHHYSHQLNQQHHHFTVLIFDKLKAYWVFPSSVNVTLLPCFHVLWLKILKYMLFDGSYPGFKFISTKFNFCFDLFGATPYHDQVLFLTQCSGVTPKGIQATMWNIGSNWSWWDANLSCCILCYLSGPRILS